MKTRWDWALSPAFPTFYTLCQRPAALLYIHKMPDMLDWTDSDFAFMRRAILLADQARAAGEVPVGAVLVLNDEIAGEGANGPITAHDPTAHAEILAMRAAAQRQRNYRLSGATLYVTLEPCAMCAGALVAARIERLVYAARDIRFGGVRSVFRIADSDLQNHQVKVSEGLLAAEAAGLLSDFFKMKR